MRSLKRVSSTLVSPSASNAQPSTANSQQSTVNGQPICVGQRIQHERFGIGEVIKLEGTGDNTKATIRFVNAGEKQLLLRFARFKVI